MNTRELIRCCALTGLAMSALFACGDGDEGEDAATESRATTSTEVATLISVESGDAACYLNVRDAEGTEEALAADFELCPGGTSDASRLVGRKVVLERRPERVMADSCEGDPECEKTETVELVVEVKAAD